LAAVHVDLQLFDERGCGPARADRREFILEVHDGLVHLVVRLVDFRVRHLPSPELTTVPIGSPTSALMMFPGCVTSNTMIGSWLSMQNVIAVESITFRPRLSTSKWLSDASFFASGFVCGSASYTPSTPECVPFNTASAPISAARSAAVVSVVKY